MFFIVAVKMQKDVITFEQIDFSHTEQLRVKRLAIALVQKYENKNFPVHSKNCWNY
jgi:hypothetical protein